jgi:AcrR family transcriptional regulator
VSSEEPLNERRVSHDRVLTVAARLFRKYGYEGTSTREIAAELGIRKASLYHYMARKQDLLYQICIETLDANLRRLKASAELPGTARDRLERVIRKHVELTLSDIDKNATALAEMRALTGKQHEDVISLRDAYEEVIRNILRTGQATGEIRSDIDEHYLALTIFSVTNWTIVWFRPGGRLTSREWADTVLAVFLDGASGPAGGNSPGS